MIAAGAVAVLAAAGFVTVRATTGGGGCTQQDVVHVAVAPEIATAVEQVGRTVSDGECFRFEVEARDPAAVADSIAVSDGSRLPDVWIPDSTLRLRRTLATGTTQFDNAGISVATAPVVFAVTEAEARQLAWPAKTLSWQDLLASPLPLGMPDPARDPVGVSALLGLRKALPAGAAPYAAVLRRLSPNTLPAVTDLYARLPSAGGSKQPIGAFPASEVSVLAYNASHADSLVASYPSQPVPSLDYPFVVLANAGERQHSAADKLLRALLNPNGQSMLGQSGFRTPDGRVLVSRPDDKLVTGGSTGIAAMPPDDDLSEVLNQWARVNTSSHAHVLIDVSGSMNAIVPGSGGKTRMQLTADAAANALTLFKSTSELSTWIFASRLDGDRDYREIIPMTPVGTLLSTGAPDELRALKATPDGATGLYDTVLAAYQQARNEWQPGRLNLVVVMTDGRDEDPQGITRDQLLAQLNGLADPHRPLPVIGIGIGTDVDVDSLNAIAGATGGKAFVAPDATKIAEVFYGALATLSSS